MVTFHGGGHSSGLRNRSRRPAAAAGAAAAAGGARWSRSRASRSTIYGGELSLPPESFALIPNGTDLAFSEPATATRNGGPTIASIGRLERYKGHHRVLEAFPEVLRLRARGAVCWWSAAGPTRRSCASGPPSSGLPTEVEFTSVPAGDAGGDGGAAERHLVVVLMSEFETHPLVALEAAAAGCRLLVADASGLAELVDEGLARGVPLDEAPAELAAAVVEELAKPPPEAMPILTSWDECAERLVELYRSLS